MHGVQQGLPFNILIAKPVLMFGCGEAEAFSSCVVRDIPEFGPYLLNIDGSLIAQGAERV